MLRKLIAAITITIAFISTASSQSSNATQVDEMTQLTNCHENYAVAHASSSATPSEIATASMTTCYRELVALGDWTYRQALADGLSTDQAYAARDQVVAEAKDQVVGFVIGVVLAERQREKSGGG